MQYLRDFEYLVRPFQVASSVRIPAGGYTFGDYLRFGLPLNIILWIAATVLIPVFYPLG